MDGLLLDLRRWRPDVTVRVIADTLMVSVAFTLALILEFEWFVFLSPGPEGRLLTDTFIQAWTLGLPVLILISLTTFDLSGFYTRTRAYASRYKALIIVQAVSISYLIFGFISYLIPQVLPIPRVALISAWLMTTAMLVGARLWSYIWELVLPSRASSSVTTTSAQSVRGESAQRILVIGGAGYIGSALLPMLIERGYRVRLLDLLLFGTEPIKDVLNHPNLEIIRADFRNVDEAVRAMRDVDAVIHLGAIVGDPACTVHEELTIEVNLMATRMLAEVAKGSGVERFIFASTCSVYGASDEVLHERSALNPVSLYARSKIASERVLLQLASERFAPVILRFGTVYGFSGRTRFDLVVNLLTAKALIEGKITVFGGDQWRPFVHVADAALAVVHSLEAPLAVVRSEIFNVGSNEQNYTIRQIGELIHRMVPSAELVELGNDGDRRNYRVNFDKIRRMLGYAPRWTVEDGVRQVLDAFARGEIEDYRDARYCNAKSITHIVRLRSIEPNNGWVNRLIDPGAQPANPGASVALGKDVQTTVASAVAP
ncbi:MAG: NAD(P)-dependent oxidoreductase [Oscillochloridaceae bacterium]|nr:NAD(P)-dependent oxidoreductase [Chloroflexaceae bacterium]MDW8391898.1 NAD(P)-dependent oxidoreductase [Oscillochloridaceae bacterium]